MIAGLLKTQQQKNWQRKLLWN